MEAEFEHRAHSFIQHMPFSLEKQMKEEGDERTRSAALESFCARQADAAQREDWEPEGRARSDPFL